MAFPLAGILSYASSSQWHIAAFTPPRLGLDSSAHLYTSGSFCLCPYSETNCAAGLAICVTDAGTHACDIHLVFIPGQRK